MDYKEFKVLVEDTERIRATKPNGVPIPGAVNMDKLKKEILDIFNSWLDEGNIKKRKELVVLGSYLYTVLFNGRIGEEFKKTYDEIQSQNDKDVALRVVLEFDQKARELASRPWEYLYYPDTDRERGFFIATRNKLILTRHVPLNKAFENLSPEEKPLRILIVVCQPEGIGAFKLTEYSWKNLRNENIPDEILDDLKVLENNEYPGENEFLNAVKKHIESDQVDHYAKVILKHADMGVVRDSSVVKTIEELQAKFSDTIEIKKLDTPTERSFTDEVNKFHPHVLHFIGYDKSDKENGYLAFVESKEDKTVRWISHVDLADAFQDFQPRLFFLHTCKGAESESYDGFKKLVLELVYSKVPAVVAMQYPVENEVAISFAKTFYQCLGEGKPIDVAVQQGRLELGMYLNEHNFSSQAFGSPVVYLQSAEGIIIAEKQEKPEIPPQPQISSKKVLCPYDDCPGYVRPGKKIL